MTNTTRSTSDLWLSFLVYGGLLLLLLSLHRRFRTRALLGGLTALAIAALWPVSERRTDSRATRIDQFMPAWQFNEVHARHVNASPERVYDATLAVTPNEILLFKTLVAIRRCWRDRAPSILNPPDDEPLLHLATRTTFKYLAKDRPREIVVQTTVGPGTDAVMNFLITGDGRGGSNVSTETRVFADNREHARKFAWYWRVIHPGSDIIRRMWLRAIARRAEGVVG